jgi:hypothetical protein
MEVAAQSQAWRAAGKLLQTLQADGQFFPVVGVLEIGMRGGHNVLNAVKYRHFTHFQGNIPGRGTVVNLRNDVAMNVYHDDSTDLGRIR